MIFNDRFDAALRLIPQMKSFHGKDAVIFAIPSGGVPLGYYLAKDCNLPMDLVYAKKVMHPETSSSAIGAVTLSDHLIDERLNVPDAFIKKEISRIRRSMKMQQKLINDGPALPEAKGKYAIIVDDGMGTGHTMLSAIRMIRNLKPMKIAVVVPVSSLEAAIKIGKVADDFICLHTINNYDVSNSYLNFSKVSDREMVQLCKAANRLDHAA